MPVGVVLFLERDRIVGRNKPTAIMPELLSR